MITNFSIFKVEDKKNDKQPDYRLSAKVDDEYVEIGAGWIKESKHGKYISVQLSKPFQQKNGYQITEYNENH